MRVPASLILLTSLMTVTAGADEISDLEFLLFLAEFTDEAGDWDAPEIDEEPIAEAEAEAETETDRVEKHEDSE